MNPQRFHQWLLIGSMVAACWLGMQAVHELGHVAGALLTGGEVERVVLHPLTISRTDLAYNPRPLAVVWAGPLLGVLLPAIAWAAAAAVRFRGAFVLRFFAGFCLVANGMYIGVGSFAGVGDCGEMLRHGSSPWQLWVFGAAATPVGLWLWHGQGANFGWGPGGETVDRSVAYSSLLVLMMLIVIGFLVGAG